MHKQVVRQRFRQINRLQYFIRIAPLRITFYRKLQTLPYPIRRKFSGYDLIYKRTGGCMGYHC